MNRHDRKAMVAEARKLVKRVVPGVKLRQACLYHAWAICAVAQQRGLRLLLQAGTCYWPCVAPDLDDGVGHNVFGYEYEDIMAAGAEAMDVMPEMHVWACDPTAGEIIDLTSGMFPAQARDLQNIVWTAVKPPDFLWCSPTELPTNVVYKATRPACERAVRLLKRSFGVGGKHE